MEPSVREHRWLFSFSEKIGENQRKSEKIGENQRKSENFGENRGISEENARKIGEFPRNPFLEVAEKKGDPAVVSGHFWSFSFVFGRFSGHFRSFLVMIPNDSAKSFLFFPFHSSTPCFYALQHISRRFYLYLYKMVRISDIKLLFLYRFKFKH